MPEQSDTALPASVDDAIEQLCRELGEKRLKQALDQTHQSLAAMGLVVTALDGLVDGNTERLWAIEACQALREVRSRVLQLQVKLAESGGPRVMQYLAQYEQERRRQQQK